jgi:hypothetical protein
MELYDRFGNPDELLSRTPTGARTRSGQPRKIFVEEGYFEAPLDVERAYWLGFIYADGSVCASPRWELKINLAEKDAEHLRSLQARIGGTFAIRTRSRCLKGGTDIASLGVYSRRLVLSLMRLGVVPRKTTNPVPPPEMGGVVLVAFLRGLFDGDGCLHVTRRGSLQAAFCGNWEVVDWFLRAVRIPVNGKPRRRGICAYAQWTSGWLAKALSGLLYNAPGPRLKRKGDIARAFA